MVLVCAALSTTLTTMPAPFAASAGVLAPFPPSLTKRSTTSAETSQPVTSKPLRFREVAMPKPIEPSPITAIFGLSAEDIRRFLGVLVEGVAPAYHALAALPKHERTPKTGSRHDQHNERRDEAP